MKKPSLLAAIGGLALSLASPVASALETPVKLLGDPAPPEAAQYAIAITPATRWVNVIGGEIVRFDVGGKSFAWSFTGATSISAFDLKRVAPPGMLERSVMAYVAPDPRYIGGDSPEE
ncbi:CzcE family metal-binding protein [Noviherbaspirillum sp. CPCC 100848]|uniref:CzcE family metal-binding protein n=1 Tax=Noviherbaspirillum album TaxID=3080276 RepID=A0ABU6J515_9BURK|nr:CzcE family metal-binding protein [Noviherbaspirillum sp. CPCC 100848]MEC4718521.1 CzcE family metal-binding protein [Noviherbaspirillum sp. CPCC 100848]